MAHLRRDERQPEVLADRSDQIDARNVARLTIAWRQSMPDEVRRGRGALTVPINHQVTPIMIGGMLYASAGDGSLIAMHPATGTVQWAYVPDEFRSTPAGAMTGKGRR